jgi:hypothetical protein
MTKSSLKSIGTIIILGAVVFGIYYYFKNKQETETLIPSIPQSSNNEIVEDTLTYSDEGNTNPTDSEKKNSPLNSGGRSKKTSTGLGLTENDLKFLGTKSSLTASDRFVSPKENKNIVYDRGLQMSYSKENQAKVLQKEANNKVVSSKNNTSVYSKWKNPYGG